MIDVIEYKVNFTYNIKNIYVWADNFKLNEEWQILKIGKVRKIEKVYMDRSPYVKLKNKYDIALYTKNKWIYLKDGKGEMTNFNDNIKIPNLEIKSIKLKPNIITYKIKFELQTLLTVLQKHNNTLVLEKTKISTTKAIIIYNELKLVLYENIIIYRGEELELFEKSCKEIKELYAIYEEQYNKLYKSLDKPKIDLHMSIAYKTWFRAKRLNQKEWPLISIEEKPNAIKWKNVWYYHPEHKVALAKRKDDNDEIYIPKIYKAEKRNNDHILPYSIKTEEYKNTKYIRDWNNEACTIIDFKGRIIETDLKPIYIVYNNMIIGKTNKKYEDFEGIQILDKNGKVSALMNEKGEIRQYNGIKIRNKICLPWHYKQILHDYNKLGRLEKGEISDLMHIGIVNENGKDIITWPEIENLYVGKSIETQRLVTFKAQNDVNIKCM